MFQLAENLSSATTQSHCLQAFYPKALSLADILAVDWYLSQAFCDSSSSRRETEVSDTMALKKSELYSSLWSSCDALRGGMDASQYKDYVLVLLFIKYVSDKYAGIPFAPIVIPEGASFKDMVTFKGKSDVGDLINKKIIAPLANANKLSDMPDFNDATRWLE
jgi:hypothetical protein